MTKDTPFVRCGFCGRTSSEPVRFVANFASNAAICAECVVRVVEVFVTGRDEPPEAPVMLTPAGRRMAEGIGEATAS